MDVNHNATNNQNCLNTKPWITASAETFRWQNIVMKEPKVKLFFFNYSYIDFCCMVYN